VKGNGQNRVHWISPTRKIEFNRRNAAVEFEQLRKKDPSEVQAWEEYRNIKRGSNACVVSPSEYHRGANAIEKTVTKRMSADKEDTQRKQQKKSNNVVADKDTNRDGDKLELLSFGWRAEQKSDRQTAITVYFTPKLNIMFRSLSSARDFQNTLKTCPSDETVAVDKYIQKVGRKNFRSVVGNMGRYVSRWKNGSSVLPSASKKMPRKLTQAGKIVGRTEKLHQVKEAEKKKSELLNVSPFKSRSTSKPDHGLNCCQTKIVRVKPRKKVSFFSERFFHVLPVESLLSDDTQPKKTVINQGMRFTLVSGKTNKEKQGKGMHFGSQETIELLYVRGKGLQASLDNICNFSRMKPEKIVSRLAHLQAEVDTILYTDRSKIEWIDEEGHEGCGFYPEDFFGATNHDSIQIRMIGPKLGLAKGMLMRKPGISRIQLPRSMKKAPKSATGNESWVAVIICKKFPSVENKSMGRFLDPDHPGGPAPKCWREKKDRKPLSEMYQRMLIGYGVKKTIVEEYTRRSKKADGLRHVHLVGCTDPTGKLPKNKVFISGYTSNSNNRRELFGEVHSKIYVSRSPCMEPSDAKIVSVVGRKPKDMSTDDWKLLCSYEFGTIIFPKSSNSTPLPCVIAGMGIPPS